LTFILASFIIACKQNIFIQVNMLNKYNIRKAQPKAKTAMVTDDLCRLIETGEILPGSKLFSTAEISCKYEVSYVTAHRALNVLVEKGLLERKNGVGTFVRGKAAAMINKIGIPLRVEANPFFMNCYEEMSRYAETLSIKTVFGSGENEAELLDRFAADGVKAIIRFPDMMQEKDTWVKLQEKGFRTVTINDWWFNGGPFPCVNTDEESSAEAALEYLYSMGHRNIVLYQDDFVDCRYGLSKVFHNFYLKHGMIPKQEFTFFHCSERSELLNIINRHHITALFSCYDCNTIELLEDYKNEGINLLEKISIVSFDDIAKVRDLGITSVRQNIPLLISEAFRVLLCDAYDKTLVRKIPGELIIRDSVKSIAVNG